MGGESGKTPINPQSQPTGNQIPQAQRSSMSSSGAGAGAGASSGALPQEQVKVMVSVVKATAGSSGGGGGSGSTKRKVEPKAKATAAEGGGGGGADSGGVAKRGKATAAAGGGGGANAAPSSTQITQCFGSAPESMSDLGVVAQFCFDRFNERIVSPVPLTTEEITNLHELFFETTLEEISNEQLSAPVDPLNPHPAHVIKSLQSCISRLDGNCRETRKKHMAKDVRLANIFDIPVTDRSRALSTVAKSEDGAKLVQLFQEGPVYTTRELLGSNNNNPAYILHDDQNNPSWVFKPVKRELSASERTMYEVKGDGAAYKQYSSGEPSELSAKTEHAASCLSKERSFPVPCTLLVEINGDVGSIQMYVRGQDAEEVAPASAAAAALAEEEAFSKDSQSMLIFDLLFAHQDRHGDNFLVKMTAGVRRLYAIDNETCLRPDPDNDLKLENRPNFTVVRAFREDVQELYSPGSITAYKEKIIRLGLMNPRLDKWLEHVSNRLQQHTPTSGSLSDLAASIMQEYKDGHWI